MGKGIKIYINLLLIILALTLCAYLFFVWYGMENAPKYFILIPLLYLIDGYPLSRMIGKQAEKGERASVKKLMLMRLVRIIGSLIILVLGIVLDKEHMLAFAALFVIFYVVYLIFETIVMKNSQLSNKTKEV